jgi:hypothetical protein
VTESSQPARRLWLTAAALVLFLSCSAGAAAYVLHVRADAAQRAHREAAFANLNQCLLGEIVTDEEQAAASFEWLRARAAVLPPGERWPDAVPWPQRCRTPASGLLNAIGDSTKWDHDARFTAWAAAYELKEQLRDDADPKAELGLYVRALWLSAKNNGLRPADRADAGGPPRAELEEEARWVDSLRLPFADFASADGGPRWHFEAALKDEPGVIASCAPSELGLQCTRWKADPELLETRHVPRELVAGARVDPRNRLTPDGSWESPSYLPHRHSPSRFSEFDVHAIVHEGAVSIRDGSAAHVDSSGTTYEIRSGRLFLQRWGASAESHDLAAQLKGRVEAQLSRVIGPGVVVSDAARRRWWRIAVSQDGVLGVPIPLPGNPFCKAGRHYVIHDTSSIIFIDTETMRPAHVVPVDLWGPLENGFYPWCRPSGLVSLPQGLVCSAHFGACTHVDNPFQLDLVADRLVSAERLDGELWVRVGDPGLIVDGRDQLVLSRTASVGQIESVKVFGDPMGGIVIVQVGQQLLGLHVTPAGEIGALEIQWR